MKNFCVQFCDALRSIRANSGKGQIAFAHELGLVQPVYARYENGAREPTLNELIRIANVLHVTPNQLLGFDDPLSALSAPPRETKPSISTGDNSPVVNGVTAGRDVIVNAPNQAPARPARRRRKASAKSDQKKMAPLSARDPGAPGAMPDPEPIAK